MGSKQEILQDICDLASQQVRSLYPNLTMMFISHTSGTFHEFVTTHEHTLLSHPAGKTAQDILEKNNRREQSSFIGMAAHHEVKWFGLASSDSVLALFNINADEFIHARDLRRTVYQLAWHVIDLMEVRQKKEYAHRFRSGPMIPKRSPMNLARLNLQADIFASMMCGLMGETGSFETMARQRAADCIAPIPLKRAEDYPFVIALEPAKYAYDVLLGMKPARAKFIHFARQATWEVAKTFDDANIRQWWSFSEPAQDMAWRNLPADHILGCAIYTSDDPFVRATAHLVADISGIQPIDILQNSMMYNSFAKQEHNRLLHREVAEKTFEEAITRGMREESGQSLISAANEQNENLTEGFIVGWCANALQAASRAFDNAMTTGASPAQAARMEFLGTKDVPPWDSLKRMSEEIISQKRRGQSVTLGQIADIAGTDDDFKHMLLSVKATMSDPGYLGKMSAANDLAVRPGFFGPAPSSPGPKGPAIKGPAPQSPVYASAPSMPGLGGGGAARRVMAERQRVKDLQTADNDTEGQDDHAGT